MSTADFYAVSAIEGERKQLLTWENAQVRVLCYTTLIQRCDFHLCLSLALTIIICIILSLDLLIFFICLSFYRFLKFSIFYLPLYAFIYQSLYILYICIDKMLILLFAYSKKILPNLNGIFPCDRRTNVPDKQGAQRKIHLMENKEKV